MKTEDMTIRPTPKLKKRIFIQTVTAPSIPELDGEISDMLQILQDDKNVIEDITIHPSTVPRCPHFGVITYSYTVKNKITMKTLITNEAGEPIGTEEHMDDGAFDYDYYNQHPEPDFDDELEECYYCGKTFLAEELKEISGKLYCCGCAGEIHHYS